MPMTAPSPFREKGTVVKVDVDRRVVEVEAEVVTVTSCVGIHASVVLAGLELINGPRLSSTGRARVNQRLDSSDRCGISNEGGYYFVSLYR
jgi:hypothetical protein